MSPPDKPVDEAVSADRKSEERSPPEEPPSERPDGDGSPNYTVFTTWEKRGIVLGAAVGALLSPLTGQIYLPALPAVAADLKVSISQVNLTMTTYMVSCSRYGADAEYLDITIPKLNAEC